MIKKALIAIIIIFTLVIGYFIADSILFDGIKPRQIDEDGIKGNFYAPAHGEKKAAVLLVGGGAWGDYWASDLAKRGYAGLSLPYAGIEDLPELPEEIPLEYFEKALLWLGKQPEVNADKLIIMGASRNAELALLIASYFPELVNGVIAYSPSSVSWSNTVLPFNSDTLKASWTYQSEDVPYLPMPKISGSKASSINTLAYWTKGLNQEALVNEAAIKVQRIAGPVLLLSGKDDQVWPSALMADMIEARLKQRDFNHEFQNLQFENAGHLISANPESEDQNRTGTMTIEGKAFDYPYGGSIKGDFIAKQKAKAKVLDFIAGV